MIWALAIGALVLLAASRQSGGLSALLPSAGNATSGVVPSANPFSPSAGGYTVVGPGSDPSRWYQGTKPGTVIVGGNPITKPASDKSIAQESITLTGTAAGLAAALGVGSTAGFGSTIVGAAGAQGFGAAGTFAGTAIPLIGIGVAVVGTVLGLIHAHHQKALAAEGRALNDADARMVQAYALVLQAVLAGEITDAQTAQQHCDQIEKDWYAEVKPVQRGSWPYTGQDLSADYDKVWVKRTQPAKGAPGYSDYHAPDPCNGACVVGHLFTERNNFVVMAAVRDALAGNHGVMVLEKIPPHETQSGMPEVEVIY